MMRWTDLLTLAFLLFVGGSFCVQTGGAGADNAEITPEDGHSWRGQKHITTGGTVDINSGGQGVLVKVDAAGIVWESANLSGMALTTESLVVANAGDYLALWSVALDGTQGKNYQFEVMTDSDNDPSAGATSHHQCIMDFDIQANTHMGTSSHCIITVAAGEYSYLAVQEPGGGAGTNFDIDHANLVLTQQ